MSRLTNQFEQGIIDKELMKSKVKDYFKYLLEDAGMDESYVQKMVSDLVVVLDNQDFEIWLEGTESTEEFWLKFIFPLTGKFLGKVFHPINQLLSKLLNINAGNFLFYADGLSAQLSEVGLPTMVYANSERVNLDKTIVILDHELKHVMDTLNSEVLAIMQIESKNLHKVKCIREIINYLAIISILIGISRGNSALIAFPLLIISIWLVYTAIVYELSESELSANDHTKHFDKFSQQFMSNLIDES